MIFLINPIDPENIITPNIFVNKTIYDHFRPILLVPLTNLDKT